MEIHGDIIRGRFRQRSAAETEERLDLLGRLMAYVRQMDMLMSDDSIPEILAQRFLTGHYDRPGQKEAGRKGRAGVLVGRAACHRREIAPVALASQPVFTAAGPGPLILMASAATSMSFSSIIKFRALDKLSSRFYPIN